MASRPNQEFGKRRPVTPDPSPSPPVKRSRHVALLLMGTMAVGGGAFALMPRQNCQPNSPGMAAPASPDAAAACNSRTSSGGGGHGGSWSRSSYYSGNPTSSGSTSTSSGATETSRGGFGGFARSIAAHFSGG
ncbi:hypothetical protein [Bradyrhizobium sp.]|jgi:hypothetical protein|uniref:hypothetical protein n=1 Tax=Bradyrhizobium sp. TaxID=376 RepID=UPI002D6863B8|nr:hypothetical protein [Bradyrhizobium sp.]HZR75167.1 hypothetical protein [Bradyrhizobium sp.]